MNATFLSDKFVNFHVATFYHATSLLLCFISSYLLCSLHPTLWINRSLSPQSSTSAWITNLLACIQKASISFLISQILPPIAWPVIVTSHIFLTVTQMVIVIIFIQTSNLTHFAFVLVKVWVTESSLMFNGLVSHNKGRLCETDKSNVSNRLVLTTLLCWLLGTV